MSRPRVCHLVECGETVGLGHLRRQLVLAESLRDAGATCRLGLTGGPAPASMAIGDIETFCWNGNDLPDGITDEIVIIDGKRIRLDIRRRLSNAPMLVVMDDMADRPIDADVVVNHNLYGACCDYGHLTTGRVFAGPHYALLGAAFRRPMGDAVRRDGILISFGSTDDGRYAQQLAAAIRRHLSDVPIRAALMQVSPASDEQLRRMECDVRVGRPLEEAIAGACLYAGAAGFSLMEVSVAGLTPVACAIASDQTLNIRYLVKHGIEAFASYEPERMAEAVARYYEMPVRPRIEHLDGCGAERLAAAILHALAARAA